VISDGARRCWATEGISGIGGIIDRSHAAITRLLLACPTHCTRLCCEIVCVSAGIEPMLYWARLFSVLSPVQEQGASSPLFSALRVQLINFWRTRNNKSCLTNLLIIPLTWLLRRQKFACVNVLRCPYALTYLSLRGYCTTWSSNRLIKKKLVYSLLNQIRY